METISISPTAKNNGIRPMNTYIPTSFLSALFPKMWIAIFLRPSNLKMKYSQHKFATAANAKVIFKSAFPGLMNEFSIICRKLNISVHDVLDAASTKWNFVNFKPGLVGGHCIGVDPYYLTYKAKKIGIDPKVILAGRKVNDGMANYFSNYFLNNLKKKKN